MPVTLVAFDFDHTLVDDNSDTYIQRLCPGGRAPPHIQRQYKAGDWIAFMNSVLQYLHQLGVQPQQLLECVSRVPWTPGMKDLLASLQDRRRYELIILSDANSQFIPAILRAAGLDQLFAAVLTNPASFDAAGQLVVRPYHQQDWCQLSSVNMCKGHILREYTAERSRAGVIFERLVYVGDGRNDYCPSLRLARADMVFARADMALHRLLEGAGAAAGSGGGGGCCEEESEPDEKEGGGGSEEQAWVGATGGRVKAAVHVWKTGFDIMAVLQRTDQSH